MTNFTLLAPTASIDLAKRLACFNGIPTNSSTVFTVQLHVHLPDPTKTDVVYNPFLKDPGHAYLTLTKTTGSQTYRLSFGFYPEEDTWISATKNTVASGIGEESSNIDRRSDIRYEMNVATASFNSLVAASKRLAQEKYYNLNSYNCAHYALEVFNTAMPQGGTISVPNSNIGYITPSGVYKKLDQLRQSGNGI
ncbi:hypothetical protein [Parapedobacter tibetensis]|uniref:hypothetical protein n=1 Tax=Parapedobacter tibetensis TaxID=2972951 RepID=UPI00214D8911|nr:hypothetical protein [Parapedobacter tibetensis]